MLKNGRFGLVRRPKKAEASEGKSERRSATILTMHCRWAFRSTITHTSGGPRATYFEQLRAKVAETPGVTMTAISTCIRDRFYILQHNQT
jgi:hypothetical protein